MLTTDRRKATVETVEKLAKAFEAHWNKPSSQHCLSGRAEAETPEPSKVVPLARMRSLGDLLDSRLDSNGDLAPPPPPPGPLPCRQKYATTWARQFGALYERSSKEVSRDVSSVIVRAITTTIFAVALAVAYSKKDIDPQKAIQDKTGAMFFMAVNQVRWFNCPRSAVA